MTSSLLPVRPHDAKALRALLVSEDVYGTVLLVLAVDRFGTECLGWHPGALRLEIEAEFGELPATTFDRLMAAVAVVTTDEFFKDASRFVQLANILAGDEFDPTVWEKADSVECAWAITEALLLHPPEDDPEPFSEDVRAYLTHVLKDEGYVTPPDVLRIALDGDFSAQVTYDFADDPELFQGIYANQRGKTAEVNQVVKENLLELVGQLKLLPLTNGSTAELEKRVAGLMRAADAGGVP